MIVTSISFTKPFGSIRVDFPFGEHLPYEVTYGRVALTPKQAEEAEQYGWKTGDAVNDGLVEVARSMIEYHALRAKSEC
jgi:hypothetical protein